MRLSYGVSTCCAQRNPIPMVRLVSVTLHRDTRHRRTRLRRSLTIADGEPSLVQPSAGHKNSGCAERTDGDVLSEEHADPVHPRDVS